MSVTARKYDAWVLVQCDPVDIYQTVVVRNETTGEIESQKRQKQSQWTIVMNRKVVGVTNFQEEVGNTRISFNVATGPTTAFTYASTGKVWVCNRNPIRLIDSETGTYEEEQEWIYRGELEDVADETFEPSEGG